MQTGVVSEPRLLMLLAFAVALVAFIAALAASWPWDAQPGDPRWEMIRQRAHAAKREVELRRRRGAPIAEALLHAEVEMEAQLATESDLEAAGRALHGLEEKVRAAVDPPSARPSTP
jgi:hypothetical protein